MLFFISVMTGACHESINHPHLPPRERFKKHISDGHWLCSIKKILRFG
jgi:hypothetical protein